MNLTFWEVDDHFVTVFWHHRLFTQYWTVANFVTNYFYGKVCDKSLFFYQYLNLKIIAKQYSKWAYGRAHRNRPISLRTKIDLSLQICHGIMSLTNFSRSCISCFVSKILSLRIVTKVRYKIFDTIICNRMSVSKSCHGYTVTIVVSKIKKFKKFKNNCHNFFMWNNCSKILIWSSCGNIYLNQT